MSIEDESAESEIVNGGIFHEVPTPLEQHPVNYLTYLGGLFRKYRRGINDKQHRSATGFSEKLAEYLGRQVGRKVISRAEKGDPTVSWGVVAAYLCEMDAWPDIIAAIEHSDTNNLRYLILIEKEIAQEIQEKKTEGIEVLRLRNTKENSHV